MFFSAAQAIFISIVSLMKDKRRTSIANNDFDVGNAFELLLDAFSEALDALLVSESIERGSAYSRGDHVRGIFHQLKTFSVNCVMSSE